MVGIFVWINGVEGMGNSMLLEGGRNESAVTYWLLWCSVV